MSNLGDFKELYKNITFEEYNLFRICLQNNYQEKEILFYIKIEKILSEEKSILLVVSVTTTSSPNAYPGFNPRASPSSSISKM